MKPTQQVTDQRADELLRAIARSRHGAGAATPSPPAAEAGDAALAERISAAVLARMKPAQASRGPSTVRRPHAAIGWAAVVAVSVVMGLFVNVRAPAQLPAYTLETAGFDQTTRAVSTTATSARSVTVGNRMVLLLRPERTVETEVVGELWLSASPQAIALGTPVAVSERGALHVDAIVGRELALAPGRHRLWLIARSAQVEVTPGQLRDAAAEIVAPGIHGVAVDLEVILPPAAPP